MSLVGRTYRTPKMHSHLGYFKVNNNKWLGGG